VLCCAVLCCAVLCCAVLCCAVLCCAVLCCAVLCCRSVCVCVRACCRFVQSLLGHVQRVYEVSWSADSRLLCSASADSTVKVWDVAGRRLLYDLPGHSDEVRVTRTML